MKKILALTLLVLFGFVSGFSQTGIRGGDFEHWKIKAGYNYYEPDSSIFWTLNQLDTVAAIAPLITVYPCDTVHGGNYSARLVTRYIPLLNVKIPGVIGTLKIDWTYERAVLGMPYPYGDSVPQVFSGYYQSYPVNNDSSGAVILLSKWNSTQHKRDTIGYNFLVFHGTINTWTPFETPVTYRNSEKADSLTILLLSCAGFNARNMFGSVGSVGSTALFDDVTLTLMSGFPLKLMPSVSVKISPNPATERLNIELGKRVKDGYFEIFNNQGQFIRKFRVEEMNQEITVGDLAAGAYFYKLTRNNDLLNSGTFIVTK